LHGAFGHCKQRSASAIAVAAVLCAAGWLIGARAQHERELSAVINSQQLSQLARVFGDAANHDEQVMVRKWFQGQLESHGAQLLEHVELDAERTQRLKTLLAALKTTDVGALTVTASIAGAQAGFGAQLSRWVEQGLLEGQSSLASAVILPGLWKSAKRVDVTVAVTASPVPNVGIGPGAKSELVRLAGIATIGEVTFPLEVRLSEGEVLSLSGRDVASVQAAALGHKLGRVLADELGIGRAAVAIVR
jgi:hypothetical protein